jgi:hypothetical protein
MVVNVKYVHLVHSVHQVLANVHVADQVLKLQPLVKPVVQLAHQEHIRLMVVLVNLVVLVRLLHQPVRHFVFHVHVVHNLRLQSPIRA